MDDAADGEPEEFVELAHPLRVATSQIVVDGDDVDASSGQGIEVAGQGGDQSLAFAGLHFGNVAAMEHDAADELDVIVTHADGAAATFTTDGEGLHQNVVQRGPFGDSLFKLQGFGCQFVVAQRLHGRFKRIDRRNKRHNLLDFALMLGAENF